MAASSPHARGAGPEAGLCDSCLHQRLVHNTRGSTFSLCERSRYDESYPRYPRLPVLACRGFQERAPASAGSGSREPEG